MECGSYNTSKEGEEGIPMVLRPQTDVPQPDEGGDGWETEEEEEILGGEEANETNEDQSNIQELEDNVEGLNVSEVELNIDGENNVLPLDWEGKLCDLNAALFSTLVSEKCLVAWTPF